MKTNTSLRLIDTQLPLGLTTKELPLSLSGRDLIEHVIVLGTLPGQAWTDEMARQQIRSGGGMIFFDAWPTPQRQEQFATTLRDAGRARDLYVLDLNRPGHSDRWSPTVTGTAAQVVEKLMALCPPVTVGADRDALEHGISVLVAALRAAKQRFTIGDVAVLLGSPKALATLLETVPAGVEQQALRDWARLLGESVSDQTVALEAIAGRYVTRIDGLTDNKGHSVFDTALPTLDMAALLAENKCLYIPVQRHDAASLAVARLLCLELNQLLAEPAHELRAQPFLLFLTDLGRMVKVPRSLLDRTSQAGIGIVVTMPGEGVDMEGPTFIPKLVQTARTKLVCNGEGLAFAAVAEFLGQNDETAFLMRNDTMQLVVRPATPAPAAATTSFPPRHLPLGLAAGESILSLDHEQHSDDAEQTAHTTWLKQVPSMTAH